jgi:hypothetical protein
MLARCFEVFEYAERLEMLVEEMMKRYRSPGKHRFIMELLDRGMDGDKIKELEDQAKFKKLVFNLRVSYLKRLKHIRGEASKSLAIIDSSIEKMTWEDAPMTSLMKEVETEEKKCADILARMERTVQRWTV